MPDQKPPRSAGDDRTVLRTLLQYQRESFARKVSGVSEAAARTSPVGSGTSLLWLTNHMADAEVTWALERFCAQPAAAVARPPAPTIAAALDRYRAVWADVDAVLDRAELDDACPDFDGGGAANLRWIVSHLLQETARHAGHADILRELVDGATGR